MRLTPAIVALLLGTTAASSQTQTSVRRPILIQGALVLEVARLVDSLKSVKVDTVGAWTIWPSHRSAAAAIPDESPH